MSVQLQPTPEEFIRLLKQYPRFRHGDVEYAAIAMVCTEKWPHSWIRKLTGAPPKFGPVHIIAQPIPEPHPNEALRTTTGPTT